MVAPCRQIGPKNRGGIYLAVLGACMVTTLLALAGLAVVRSLSASARDDDRGTEALLLAEDFKVWLDHLAGMGVNWRASHTSGKWYSFTLRPGTETVYQLVDEDDGNLADDPAEPARLRLAVRAGQTRRVYSLLVHDPGPENLLYNPGFEQGTAGWTCWDYAYLDVETGTMVSGRRALSISRRSSFWNGPNQYLDVDKIENGGRYEISAWVRCPDDAMDMTVTLQINSTGDGTKYAQLPMAAVGDAWRQLTGTVTVSWSGSLTSLRYYVESRSQTDAFLVDDCVVRPARTEILLYPVPGTWRRESLD